MSARKIQSVVSSEQKISLASREKHFTLSPEAVHITKSGIEFTSATPFTLWTEMTVTLETPADGKVNCTGVVVSCVGDRHRGFHVAVLFTGVSPQSQARLNTLAYS